MNVFKKYYPNVWVAECDEKHERGELIILETKHGKEVEAEVYNFIKEVNGKYWYSIVRVEEQSYAERKAEQYQNRAISNARKSEERYKASLEGKEFLSLGEPIKVGHHSEKRHRALFERNYNRMAKSVEYADKAEEAQRKAEYWESRAKDITLAMPESIGYFEHKLKLAEEKHKGMKNGTIPRTHAYSLEYAKKEVNEMKKKYKIAKILWG